MVIRAFIRLIFIFGLIQSCQENTIEIPTSTIAVDSLNKNIDLASHVYISSIINDSIKAVLLFDSGANGFILDHTFLSNHQLQKNIINRGNKFAYGVGEGKAKQTYLSNIKLTIDERTYDDLELRAMPLDSMFGEVLNHTIDGIVGCDVFGNSVIKFNFDRKRFEILDSISDIDKATFHRLSYKFKYRKPIIRALMKIDDQKSINGNLIFDMGSARNISLTHRKGKDENLLNEHLFCIVDSISGIGGKSESCKIKAENLILGDLQIDLDSIEIGKDQKGALGLHTMYDGMIGMEIISNYNLIFDHSNYHIWLSRRE